MAAEEYKEVFQYDLRNYNVDVQVNESKEQLTVVVNRLPDKEVDYDEIALKILDRLAEWELSHEKFKIVGRVQKQTKVEWQQVFENPKVKKGGFLGGLFGGKKK